MKKEKIIKYLIALLGIFFLAIGVAINASTKLGNDSVGILYDGIRNALNFSQQQLGLISNVITFLATLILFFIGRKYLNVGTLLYVIPFGTFVSIGTYLYNLIIKTDALSVSWCYRL